MLKTTAAAAAAAAIIIIMKLPIMIRKNTMVYLVTIIATLLPVHFNLAIQLLNTHF